MAYHLIVFVKKPGGGTYRAKLTIAQFLCKQAVICIDSARVSIMLDEPKNWNEDQQWIEIARLEKSQKEHFMSNEFWKMLFFTIGSLGGLAMILLFGAYVLRLLMEAFVKIGQAEKMNR